jgi:hypothetical protein
MEAMALQAATSERDSVRSVLRRMALTSTVLTTGEEDAPQLPAEVLSNLLDHIPDIAHQARQLVGPILENRERLRDLLREKQWIEDIEEEPTEETVAAVDGAQVQDSLYAGDLLVAVAVAAEGLTPAGLLGSCPVHSTWNRFLVHDADLDRLGKAAMVIQELHLLSRLPHDICILDGSHQTPVIVLNSALTSTSQEVRQAAVEVCEEFNATENLARLCDPHHGASIVASPKSDSSRDLSRYFERAFSKQFPRGLRLPASDKVLAALVLEPGEMLKAFPVNNSWKRLHIRAERVDESSVKKLAGELNAAIEPLKQQTIRITYIKPATCSTAVKVEFKENLGADWRRRVARMVTDETPGPHLQEPFCQYLADLWAKSVSLGVRAQMHGVRLELAGDDGRDYLEYMLRSYRTLGE